MSTASLSTGNGPGSSIALAPETIRIRDALIEKFSGTPLEEMNDFMAIALSNETDELRRLGILAARIYILRNRVANLKEFNRNPSLTSVPELDTATLSRNLPVSTEPNTTEDGEATSETDQWSRIQMTEPGEVNGVRFLSGTVIDAQPEDADKLIHSGKAIRVDMDGNTVDHLDNDFSDSSTPPNNHDESAQSVDDDTSISAASDDDITEPAETDDASVSDDLQEASDAVAEAGDAVAEASDALAEASDAVAEASDSEAQTDSKTNDDRKGSTS